MVLGKNIAHDMKSGAEGAHFFGALLLTFTFDKHRSGAFSLRIHTAGAKGSVFSSVFNLLGKNPVRRTNGKGRHPETAVFAWKRVVIPPC